MVFLKLMGYAVGSIVMYWGVLLLLFTPWLFAVILIVLVNQIWNQITGKCNEWTWVLAWSDTLMKGVHHVKAEWIGWIPGILIQIWYGGYAANLVHTSTLEVSAIAAIAIHLMGVVGMIIAAAIFYWIYSQIVEINLERWRYLLISGACLSAYFALLQHPQLATLLSASWQRVFTALLVAAI